MSSQIKINYEAVYTKTAELRNRIEAELHEMEAGYRNVQSDLHHADSATNERFMAVIDAHQRKSRVTAEIFHQLLLFIEHSSREVEREELLLKNMFDMGQPGSIGTAGSTTAEPTQLTEA